MQRAGEGARHAGQGVGVAAVPRSRDDGCLRVSDRQTFWPLQCGAYSRSVHSACKVPNEFQHVQLQGEWLHWLIEYRAQRPLLGNPYAPPKP